MAAKAPARRRLSVNQIQTTNEDELGYTAAAHAPEIHPDSAGKPAMLKGPRRSGSKACFSPTPQLQRFWCRRFSDNDFPSAIYDRGGLGPQPRKPDPERFAVFSRSPLTRGFHVSMAIHLRTTRFVMDCPIHVVNDIYWKPGTAYLGRYRGGICRSDLPRETAVPGLYPSERPGASSSTLSWRTGTAIFGAEPTTAFTECYVPVATSPIRPGGDRIAGRVYEGS